MTQAHSRILMTLSVIVMFSLFACSGDDDSDEVETEVADTPTTRVATPTVQGRISEDGSTTDWVYWLSDIDLAAIASTRPEIAVIDYSQDGAVETEFSKSQISTLRAGMFGDAIVISYMSIGEAEDYRFYWQESWNQGNSGSPSWLEAENSNWPGNFKVRFWEPEWQSMIFGTPDSYLDRIIAAGFDGVYMDIVDAYEYFGEKGHSTAEDEMVQFVTDISEYAKARDSEFLIFPQNAPELGERSDYLAIVDGIGMEGVYFGWDEPNRATQQEDTEWLEEQLGRFVDAGKIVLAVDYASSNSDISAAYERSRAQGFRSTVTHVDLDRLPSPAP